MLEESALRGLYTSCLVGSDSSSDNQTQRRTCIVLHMIAMILSLNARHQTACLKDPLPGFVSFCERVKVPPSPPKMNHPLLGTKTLAEPAAVGTSKSEALKHKIKNPELG